MPPVARLQRGSVMRPPSPTRGAMPDNYTTLQRNTLDGLSEGAAALYLKLVDALQGHRPGQAERQAFLAACRYEDAAGRVLDRIILSGCDIDPQSHAHRELSAFFAERYRHNFMERNGVAYG